MIHRQQLKATQALIVERYSLPEKPLELTDLPYEVRHLVLEHLTDAQNLKVFLRRSAIPISLPEAARLTVLS